MKLIAAQIVKLKELISESKTYKREFLVPNFSFTKFSNHSLLPKPTLKITSKNKTLKKSHLACSSDISRNANVDRKPTLVR